MTAWYRPISILHELAYKQFKLLYSAVQERHDWFSSIDVILPVTELERANMVFEKIRFVPKGEKANTEQQAQKKEAPERKKEYRSEHDSPDTRDSSFTSRSDERNRTTNERPSVLEKLKGFAEEKQTQRAPAKQKTKSRPKAR